MAPWRAAALDAEGVVPGVAAAAARLDDVVPEVEGMSVDGEPPEVDRVTSQSDLLNGRRAAARRLWAPVCSSSTRKAFVATVLLAVVTLCSNLLASTFIKDSRINDQHQLVAWDGTPITMKASIARSYATLVDLPMQSHDFLEQMSGISIWLGSELRHFRVAGFSWSNTSYMVLQTACQREVIIAAGKAFIRERSEATGQVRVTHATTPASEPTCGRRLAGLPAGRTRHRASTYEDLVRRYRSETGLEATGRWRRLSEDPLAERTGLYEWFGALIASEAQLEALSEEAMEARDASYCDFNTRGLECKALESSRDPRAPKLSSKGFNRFLLAGSGKTWLLYLDLSDWDPDRAIALTDRRVRAKLAQDVFVDPSDETGSAIRVTESVGAEAWAYQLMHPAVSPSAYNQSTAAAHDGNGLDLAEEVLQSASFDHHKGECRSVPPRERPTQTQPSDVSIAFDCDTGTYMWSVGGWRVLASADGDIRAFLFGNAAGAGNVTSDDDDDSAVRLHYRVLAVTDGGDARADFSLNRAFARGDLFRGCTPEIPFEGGRRLQRRLGARLPGTNWCGPGQNPSVDNFCLKYDGDWACRRHDACTKTEQLGGVPVVGCSCDRDLHAGRGTGTASIIINTLYHPNGAWPCVAFVETCKQWGWVESGRRRRFGYSVWGVQSVYPCSNWNYINKYSGTLTEWGYVDPGLGKSLHSQQNWPGCVENTRDFSLSNCMR